tara:strand:- start:881 stop:2035 length:1155 start_codon:yes stop_codon:yes gene_type:complete
MPVLSLGGMRFQKSWKQLNFSDISDTEQLKVVNILNLADYYGFDHIETARHYGTSELQLGPIINTFERQSKIIQTKIPPNEDINIFEEELKNSFEKLGLKKIDLISIHGINTPEHLHQSIKKGGCIDVLRKWQKDNLIGNIGFSTHANLTLIEKAISSNKFDYVNLHWYFINQINIKAIRLARKYDLGVFIISPTDKGGHLHTPSDKLLKLCKPLHPIVFNDLFCLSNQDVHTISVGISKETDFHHHLEAISLLNKSNDYVPSIQSNLIEESIKVLGDCWFNNWHKNIPYWKDIPGEMNIYVLLWLSNLLEAWEMEDFVKSRYQLLGNGSHWFPGNNANLLDINVSENDLFNSLKNHINPTLVIDKLRILKEKFGNDVQKRMSQ